MFKEFIRKLLRLIGYGSPTPMPAQKNPVLSFSGDYGNWAEAEADAFGYDASNILEKCKSALLKVKTGEAVHERDSVLFTKIDYSWPLLTGLLLAASQSAGRLSVLDFGGSLGSTFFQNRKFLSLLPEMKWGIVEQPNFVACGKQHFENKSLRFFESVNSCIDGISPNVLVASGSIQYLRSPFDEIKEWKSKNFDFIIIDRTYFVESADHRLTLQRVGIDIYEASYPAWFFNEAKFIQKFEGEYELVEEFDSYLNAARYLENGSATEKGMIFKRRI